jgi:hypothetical protein
MNMVQKRSILLPIGLTLSLGITGAVGFGAYRTKSLERARESGIQKLVDRFRACPDRYRATGECHSPPEIVRMRTDADAKRRQGKHGEAGLLYAKLGMGNEAREMAAECDRRGDKAGSKAIVDEMAVREEAAARMR